MLKKIIKKRIKLAEQFIQNCKWYDISLLKLYCIVAALLIAKYFPILLQANWYWYVLVLVFIVPRLVYIAFIK